MKKPNKEDDKYWLPMVVDKVKGTKDIPFDHLYYERDLERYIECLESKVNNGVLDDVINTPTPCSCCGKLSCSGGCL